MFRDETTGEMQTGGARSGELREEPPIILAFKRATVGDAAARGCWQKSEGGAWQWQSDGLRVAGDGIEWAAIGCPGRSGSWAGGLSNFVIELTVSGRAEAAGLSFGPYKDFLAPLAAGVEAHCLQLEVDAAAGCWAFRVDGQLREDCWWNAAVGNVADLLNGTLTFKAKRAVSVSFQNLRIETFDTSCRLSVITTCNRFLQRLRVSLRNWCHQDLPTGAYEVLVVNPQSPDGTHEHLATVARSYAHVRVREIAVGAELALNKGAMINRAVAASRGEWVWLTDADCLFPPDCAAAVLNQIGGRRQHLFYGARRYLTAAQTDYLLSGRADSLRDFAKLASEATARAPENAPWGYTQIIHRSTLGRVHYREDHNHFAQTDEIFAADCRRYRVTPQQLEGLFCLHLDHPFAWYGTDVFL